MEEVLNAMITSGGGTEAFNAVVQGMDATMDAAIGHFTSMVTGQEIASQAVGGVETGGQGFTR